MIPPFYAAVDRAISYLVSRWAAAKALAVTGRHWHALGRLCQSGDGSAGGVQLLTAVGRHTTGVCSNCLLPIVPLQDREEGLLGVCDSFHLIQPQDVPSAACHSFSFSQLQDREEGLLGVCDFFTSSKYDLPLRQMTWLRRFFW